jgi:hypothetical protein
MTDLPGDDPLVGAGDRDRVPLPFVENRPFDALERSFFEAGEAIEEDDACDPPEATRVTRLRLRPRLSLLLLPALGGFLLLVGTFSGSKLGPATISRVAVAEAASAPAVSGLPAADVAASPKPSHRNVHQHQRASHAATHRR